MNISPDILSHLSIFICVFFLALGFINLLPELLGVYREQYQSSSRQTARELNKFFLNVRPTQILIASAVVGILLGFLSGSWVVAIAVMAAGLVAPKIILNMWKEVRSTQFEAQLMDALLLIANSLRSGLDIIAGLERVATSMKAPISEEFGLVINAYRLGTPLESALMELTTRINSRPLETVIYAINIQRETGGNIIKIFEQLVVTMREESKLQKKSRAITAQARSQIVFLAGFPWVLGLFVLIVSPDMLRPALASTWGQIVLVFLVIWEAIGIVIAKKIVIVDI